jgi:hypothetical protein
MSEWKGWAHFYAGKASKVRDLSDTQLVMLVLKKLALKTVLCKNCGPSDAAYSTMLAELSRRIGIDAG